MGKKYSQKGATYIVNYLLDASGRVYIVVTNLNYSPRIAFKIIEEFQQAFQSEFGLKVPAAKEESLTRPAKKLFLTLYEKFSNPGNMDQLTNVQTKLDIVKTNMQDNIQQMLQNDEKVAKIDASAEKLNEMSVTFQKGTKELKGTIFTYYLSI